MSEKNIPAPDRQHRIQEQSLISTGYVKTFQVHGHAEFCFSWSKRLRGLDGGTKTLGWLEMRILNPAVLHWWKDWSSEEGEEKKTHRSSCINHATHQAMARRCVVCFVTTPPPPWHIFGHLIKEKPWLCATVLQTPLPVRSVHGKKFFYFFLFFFKKKKIPGLGFSLAATRLAVVRNEQIIRVCQMF